MQSAVRQRHGINGFGVGVLDDLTSMESGISGRPGHQAGYVASKKTNFNISLLLSLLACVSTNKNKSERIEELRAARLFVQ